MYINFSDLKKLHVVDIALLVVFAVYLIFPISSPQWVVPLIDSPMGMVILFAVAVSLFVYRHPIAAILFVFVAYELLRRNHYEPPASPVVDETQYLATKIPQPLPSQQEKDAQLMAMNPLQDKSLEEEVITLRAPIGKSDVPTFVQTSFSPVADRTGLPMSQF
jgi:hypothetical protein